MGTLLNSRGEKEKYFPNRIYIKQPIDWVGFILGILTCRLKHSPSPPRTLLSTRSLTLAFLVAMAWILIPLKSLNKPWVSWAVPIYYQPISGPNSTNFITSPSFAFPALLVSKTTLTFQSSLFLVDQFMRCYFP